VVVVAVALVVGGVLGLVAPPVPAGTPHPVLRSLWPLGIALAAQAAMAVGPSRAEVFFAVCSMAAVAAVAAANRHLAGVAVVGVGASLNLVSLVANGGIPVDPDALVTAGLVEVEDLPSTDPGAARHLDRGDDPLPWLGDVVPIAPLRAVVSFGDLLVAVGLADAVAALARRRARDGGDGRTGRDTGHHGVVSVPHLRAGGRAIATDRPLVMGIVNASPESFSDGRPGEPLDAQVARALRLLDEGADILDVGGQSAITNVAELDEHEEIDRVVPLIRAITAARPGVLVSIDAYRPAVVEAALDAGACIVNDVSGLLYEDVATICARNGAALVVMHTRARPKQRLQDPDLYGDVIDDVVGFLRERTDAAVALGVEREAIIVDPGIDFAKTPAQSIALLRGIDDVLALGRPCLLAISRKDFIGALTEQPPRRRLAGTLATAAHVGWRPGLIYRVHDVDDVHDFLTVLGALAGEVPVARDLRLRDEIRHEPRVATGGDDA
jgi:dihydropteroate synthase